MKRWYKYRLNRKEPKSKHIPLAMLEGENPTRILTMGFLLKKEEKGLSLCCCCHSFIQHKLIVPYTPDSVLGTGLQQWLQQIVKPRILDSSGEDKK